MAQTANSSEAWDAIFGLDRARAQQLVDDFARGALTPDVLGLLDERRLCAACARQAAAEEQDATTD